MKRGKIAASEANLVLGENLQKLRLKQDVTPLQLGKKVNVLAQQIVKYEKGAFIPLSMLEKLALALGGQVEKKIIRRISRLRTQESEDGTNEQEALIELYHQALGEDQF